MNPNQLFVRETPQRIIADASEIREEVLLVAFYFMPPSRSTLSVWDAVHWIMPQTKWRYFVLGYQLGESKDGHRCWMSIDPGESESISTSLNNFGKDGWELVNTIFLAKSEEAQGQEIMCFFKKPIP